MSLLTTPAVLLRSHPYSETSQILRFYTFEAGVVGVMAKGVRKAGGKGGSGLSTFAEGQLVFYDRASRELQTFRSFAPEKHRKGLARDPARFAAAGILGEVVLQHAGADANPQLYLILNAGLERLEATPGAQILPPLLLELWGLIGELGYAPEVGACVACGRALDTETLGRFDFPAGGIRCPDCQEGSHGPRLGPGARDQLAALIAGVLPDPLLRPRAHLRLASDFVTYHISGGTPLRSMAVLAHLLPKAEGSDDDT